MSLYCLLMLAILAVIPSTSQSYCYDCHSNNNPTMQEIMCQLNLGDIPLCPAKSCKEITDIKLCNARSGLHWLSTTCGTNFHGFCNVTIPPSQYKGWTRIGYIQSNTGCPDGLEEVTAGSIKLCRKTVDVGCSSVKILSNGIHYSKVCGRVYGYVNGSSDAFQKYPNWKTCTTNCTIDQLYVDGVSITHGSPRQHIWTMTGTRQPLFCPCNESAPYLPSFVGQDYFCDVEPSDTYVIEDRLWDGVNCRTPCCDRYHWFCKDLNSTTNDDIEFRVCADEARSNEDIFIEFAELYVH